MDDPAQASSMNELAGEVRQLRHSIDELNDLLRLIFANVAERSPPAVKSKSSPTKPRRKKKTPAPTDDPGVEKDLNVPPGNHF